MLGGVDDVAERFDLISRGVDCDFLPSIFLDINPMDEPNGAIRLDHQRQLTLKADVLVREQGLALQSGECAPDA